MVNAIVGSGKNILLTKNHVKQVKWNQVIQHEAKCVLVKEFLKPSMCQMRYENLLKSAVCKICVEQICVHQGVGVCI